MDVTIATVAVTHVLLKLQCPTLVLLGVNHVVTLVLVVLVVQFVVLVPHNFKQFAHNQLDVTPRRSITDQRQLSTRLHQFKWPHLMSSFTFKKRNAVLHAVLLHAVLLHAAAINAVITLNSPMMMICQHQAFLPLIQLLSELSKKNLMI